MALSSSPKLQYRTHKVDSPAKTPAKTLRLLISMGPWELKTTLPHPAPPPALVRSQNLRTEDSLSLGKLNKNQTESSHSNNY